MFLFAAFLFCPIFVCLFFLLFSVTRVFETISPLPYSIYLKLKLIFESEFLHPSAHFVKILIFAGIIPLPLVNATPIFDKLDESPLVLAIGQYHEIPGKYSKFIRVNKDVIKADNLKSQGKIRIKGLMQGFSELILWNQQGEKRTINVYVFSKQKYLGTLANIESFKNMGLKATISGPYIQVKGTLSYLDHYKLLQKIKRASKDSLHLNVLLDRKLKNQIIGEVYYLFFKQYIDQIRCEKNNSIDILCYYPETVSPSKDTIKHLTDNYSIKFVTINNKKTAKNYKLKMKIIALEKLDGEELSLGLDSLEGNLSEIINQGITGLIAKNNFVLKSQNVELSTIAEPQSIIQIDKQATMQVGSEIPYQTHRKEGFGSKTEWKFAGLKVAVTLKKEGDKLKVDYQTEFTRPDADSSISGSKEKSSATIGLGKPVEIFQIGFKTFGKRKGGIPFLKSIPLLGALFQSKTDQQTYKKISGIIYITEG